MPKVFNINSTLENNILSNIPNNYSNLEKAILIYKRLCEKLQYSFDYYLDTISARKYFSDASNLINVDGETNKDVVCFTFNAILSQLFFDADVIQDIDINFYDLLENRFPHIHDELFVQIDDVQYKIDATAGVLDNNDLVLSKYACHRPNGWICSYGSTDEAKSKLLEAIEKVYSENQSLDSKLEEYMKQKKFNNSFITLPIDMRVQMFLELANSADYSLFGFNNLLKYKHLCFAGEDYGFTKDNLVIDKKIDLIFAKDKHRNIFKAFLFYNPQGYTDDAGYENFENLQIYEISPKDKLTTKLSHEDAVKFFNNWTYVTNTDNKIYPKMITNGKLNIVYEFKDGKPLYDHHMNPVNVTKKFRKHIKTDKTEELPLE